MTSHVSSKPDNEATLLLRHMPEVQRYENALGTLQAVWDNLTLLGQLSGTGIDIHDMREDFAVLTDDLLQTLAAESRKKAVLEMQAKAQVAIDILIRNLFERTADIGFLATDAEIAAYAAATGDYSSSDTIDISNQSGRISSRFRDYVQKYSVYEDILLLDLQGRVLAQLDSRHAISSSSDPLIQEAANMQAPYLEVFRHTDLQPHQRCSLIYAQKVKAPNSERVVGVLCLCFRFDNECERIFSNLLSSEDWSVITLLSPQGEVIATSDPYQIPLGAPLQPVREAGSRIVRFASRRYLAVSRTTQGYQGYFGPGWFGHVMVPLEQIFEGHDNLLQGIDEDILEQVMDSPQLFPDKLRSIPRKAEQIQQALNRAVWNGSVRSQRELSANADGQFIKTLLREIGNTGLRTRDVFSSAIANLHGTVVSAMLQDCAAKASLAIDIMDRNLYERANDCRWWALTEAFQRGLADGSGLTEKTRAQMAHILATINGLYTVYTSLMLFDHKGRVIAVSNHENRELLDQTLDADWVSRTLRLQGQQAYTVSDFAPSTCYGGQHTYLYSAAIHHPKQGHAVGGIGIVFDATPQFAAMLTDALPRNEAGEIIAGCFGVYLERSGKVIASTNPAIRTGEVLDLPAHYFDLPNGGSYCGIVHYGAHYYALGVRMSSGYREYKGASDPYTNDVAALIFLPLVNADSSRLPALRRKPGNTGNQHYARNTGISESHEIATFYIGGEWHGLRSCDVLEAIDTHGITAMRTMPEYVRGCVLYRNTSVIVFDLRHFLPEVSRRSTPSQIVIVRGDNQQPLFGILVDELGEIPEIPVSRIESIDTLFANQDSVIESIVKPPAQQNPAQASGSMLVILSVDNIMERALRVQRSQTTEAAE